MATAYLKPRKSKPFHGRHPWALDSAIDRMEGNPADGDEIDLCTDKGRFIARGTWNSNSRIRVRLYTWNQSERLDDEFWRRRLTSAVEFRKSLGYNNHPLGATAGLSSSVENTGGQATRGTHQDSSVGQLGYDDSNGAARLVFSEGDFLSGLIVDRYADYLAVQVTALAIEKRLPAIIPMLVELLSPRGIVIRTERGVGRAEGITLRDGPCWGQPPDGPLVIVENNLQYEVDLGEGQKTGFYLDQRDNRLAAARYFHGRRVLDAFCYSGGFAMNAIAHGRAAEVLGIDASQRAVDLAAANVRRNELANITFQTGDGFDLLQNLLDAGERFGGIVLDPPKFARSRKSLAEALRAYHWLNRLAVGLLEPGGILATCSCSGNVTREDFLMMLVGVAQQTGRDIQILEQRGPAPDHPVSATCLEGEYLKCFICRVA